MISSDHVWLWTQFFNSVCNVCRNTSIENEICPLDFNSWDVYILGLVYICFNVSFKMQAPMHFMQLMCLHFIFFLFCWWSWWCCYGECKCGKRNWEVIQWKNDFLHLLYSNKMHFTRCFNLETYNFYDDK